MATKHLWFARNLHTLLPPFLRWTWVSRFDFGFLLLVLEDNLWREAGQVFYWMDVIAAAQPAASEHWRKHTALTLAGGLPSSLIQPPPDSWQKGFCCLYAGCAMSVPVLSWLVARYKSDLIDWLTALVPNWADDQVVCLHAWMHVGLMFSHWGICLL